MKKFVVVFTLMVLIMGMVSYSYAAKDKLVFGVTPWETKEHLQKMFKPLLDKIGKELGVKTKFFVAKDYDQLGNLVKKGKIDIGFFSPVAYVKAKDAYPALKYIVTLSELNDQGKPVYFYEGYILVKKDSPYKSINDLKGKKFGFTSKESSSGYKYPMVIFKKMGIVPDKFFSKVYFLGKHPKVTDAIANGNIDAGATWDGNYINAVKKHGDIFRIIKKTAPIPYDAWAANANVSDELLSKLKKMLLSLKPNDPVLNTEGFPYKGFVERNDAFYNVVRDVLKASK